MEKCIAVTIRALCVCLLLRTILGKSSTKLADETTTLLGLKQAWGNPSELSTWSTDTANTTCSWAGVVCDSTNKTVVELSLSGSWLDGPIPDTLGNLTSLQALTLSDGLLSGYIPESIGNLTSLQVLDLSNNSIRGSMEMLGKLSNLLELELSRNNLTGSIPDTFGNLLSIQILDLSVNNLAGSIPDTFGNLQSIQYLDLSVNNLAGSIPATLGNLTSMWHLDLGINTLEGPIPAQLGNLSMVQRLALGVNNLDGPIPDTLGNLGLLQSIDLSHNQLEGPIPGTFGNLSMLAGLYLNNNNLTGFIPLQLTRLTNLVGIHLFQNQLIGPIPHQIGQWLNVTDIDLRLNKLTGPIPETIENLTALVHLWLNDNLLSGDIPQNFTAISNLQSLRVANNNLSGPIPTQFSTPSNLNELDVGGNFLSGEVAESLISTNPGLMTLNVQDNCLSGTFPQVNSDRLQHVSSDNNCFNGTVCNAKCVPTVKGVPPGKKSSNYISIAAGVVAGVLLVVGLGVFFVIRKLRSTKTITRTYQVPGSVRQYTLLEVIEATRNLTTKIGEGGYSTVYKAEFKDGAVAAVKHFNKKKREENFEQEVVFLARLNHRYLVNLIGYCDERGELMLMYDFMDGGNLFETLHGDQGPRLPSNAHLEWKDRVQILLNIARGIEYLHYGTDPPLIHRDIKSANILLSSSEGKTLNAKLADFGLGKQTILVSYEVIPDFGSEEPSKSPLTRVAGTPGYMDPEYLIASQVTPKSDVFSYGVVLLEVITGRQAIFIHSQERTSLVEWARPYLEGNQILTIVDPQLRNESIPESHLVSMAVLIRHCIDNDSRNRPTIKGVVKTLLEVFRPDPETRHQLYSSGSTEMSLRNFKSTFLDSNSMTYTQSEILPRD